MQFRLFTRQIALDGDLIAGLTLAAIGIPEQMATAQLAGLAPQAGLIAFVAASAAFAVFGFRRVISVGADSTIAPIFATGLAAIAAVGSPQYASLAAILAVMVGVILLVGGRLGVGWIADLFSVPVTTGFLAGIALHIAISQLPVLLGLPPESGSLLHRLAELYRQLGQSNLVAVAIGIGVLAITAGAERLNARIPGALIGVVGASLAVAVFAPHAVGMLGTLRLHLPRVALPQIPLQTLAHLSSLAIVVALVVMLQTGATVRSFAADDDSVSSVSRTFMGVGAANVLSGLAGAIAVNASPPRTAIMTEAGARTQVASLVAAALAVVLALFGSRLLAYVPSAALAGILLFVAMRIIRVQTAALVLRQSPAEFLLMAATALAIVLLPLEMGIAAGVILSLLHGTWTASHTQVFEFERIDGTATWWVPNPHQRSEKVAGVMVLAFPAPLSFLNAHDFRRGVLGAIRNASRPISLLVLEANGIAEIDFTAAQMLSSIIEACRAAHILLAVARMESVRAQQALERFKIAGALGADRLFLTVEEAVRALGPHRASAKDVSAAPR